MIDSLDDIVNVNSIIFKTYSVSLKDITRLIVSKTAAFDMVGVVCQLDLQFLVDTAVQVASLLLT